MTKKPLADSPERLRIFLRDSQTRPDDRRRLHYRGLSLEYLRVAPASEYDFSWRGELHYLAMHDLVMERGDMDVEGLPTIPGGDLRDKMTYVPAGRRLTGWSKTTSRQNGVTVLQFDPARLSEETGGLLDGREAVPLIYFDDQHLLSTMKKLEDVVTDGFDHPAIYVETLALLAVLELGKLQGQGHPVASDRTGRLSAAQERLLRDYIEEHVTVDVSLDALSQLVQLSRFHLSRRFKATFGVAPHSYIIERRFELAKRLLKESDLSVADIATATGFSSAGLFIRTFRMATGVTPLVFRRS